MGSKDLRHLEAEEVEWVGPQSTSLPLQLALQG